MYIRVSTISCGVVFHHDLNIDSLPLENCLLGTPHPRWAGFRTPFCARWDLSIRYGRGTLMLRIVRSFREGVTLPSASESFREGWQDVIDGNTHPVDDLWKRLDS